MRFVMTGDRSVEGKNHKYSGSLTVEDGGERYDFVYEMRFPADPTQLERLFDEEQTNPFDHVGVSIKARGGERELGYEQGYGLLGMFIMSQCDVNNETGEVSFPLNAEGELRDGDLSGQKMDPIRHLLRAASEL